MVTLTFSLPLKTEPVAERPLKLPQFAQLMLLQTSKGAFFSNANIQRGQNANKKRRRAERLLMRLNIQAIVLFIENRCGFIIK